MRFIYTSVALTFVLLSLASAPTIAVGKERSHVGGKFALDLDGPEEGFVKSVDGGNTTPAVPKVVTKRPAPAQQKVTPVLPKAAILPSAAVGASQPLCPKPPCYLPIEKRKTDK